MSNCLEGRTVVVFGVANKRSIAWAIAQQMQQAGAQLAITYQNERLKQEADELIAVLPNSQAFQCDVSRDEEIAQLFEQLKSRYGKLDALVHSIAFAPAEELKGEFAGTSREGFRIALDISVYSLVAMARAARPLMTEGGSIMTLTYYGAEKVVPRYNVMGVAKAALEASVRYLAYDLGKDRIRVNAISPGIMATEMLEAVLRAGPQQAGEDYQRMTEVKRNGGQPPERAAALAWYLASPASQGITGRLISAIWDPWPELAKHVDELNESDIYTLRRITPEDRGKQWK
jgi:enoyl-[acyl-carrier protein] reductase I